MRLISPSQAALRLPLRGCRTPGCDQPPRRLLALRAAATPWSGDGRAQRGVALVVTVIMLTVITFLAIAFLVLSRREKGAVTVATDQTVAQLAAEAALARAQNGLLAPILAFTNPWNYDLRVSTNYVNPFGFDQAQPKSQLTPATRYWQTNVNYLYANGTPLTGDDYRQNLANLFYDPRPPVFVTNRQTGLAEFRYYLDLNRNGRYDTNGWLPVISPRGTYVDANGNDTLILSNAVYQFFVGDPEWIGVLERPDLPHSSTNRFTSRYAWIAIPAGKALDLNRIHNQAKMINPRADGFLRNMGVAPFEMNLAACLADLNTNLWNRGNRPGLEPPYSASAAYFYVTNLAQPSQGAAFDDAFALLRYRYGQNYNNLRSVLNLFGTPGVNAFSSDGIDGYVNGPLMLDTVPPRIDNDGQRTGFGWPGSDTPNHFFVTQDFWDKNKTSPGQPNQLAVTERLREAGAKTNSYDRYTYYRLLSVLGTDSDPEPPDKMNLNWDNLVQRHPVTGVASATNFLAWRPLDFFLQAADRLLRSNTLEWRNRDLPAFLATFGTNQPFSVSNIPVLISNRLVYTPAVHRLLQLAANLWDIQTTNRLPTVFRPLFTRRGTDVFITGYEQVVGDATPYLLQPVEAQLVGNGTDMRINVYGVPWVVGAKKGLPNFNEFAMQTVFDITRKLKIRRRDFSRGSHYETNQLYVIGLSNAVAAEFWNSYRDDYTNAVLISITNDVTVILTNQYGVAQVNNGQPLSYRFRFGNSQSVTRWRGYGPGNLPAAQSFVVPLQTNLVLVPPAIWLNGTPNLNTNLTLFPRHTTFPIPRWGLVVKTRLQAVMRDVRTGQIVDYVQLDNLDDVRDLAAEFSRSNPNDPNGPAWGSLWDTNRLNGSLDERVATRGIHYQIRIAMGELGGDTVDWTSYGQPPLSKHWEIDSFRVFMDQSPLRFAGLVNTNLEQQVPFSPSRRISRVHTWQANDPLVHYLADDLRYWPTEDEIRDESVKPGVAVQALENIGKLNKRYQPWGGNPQGSTDAHAYDLTIKDAGVRGSDDWDFPTNKLPNVGWLGRVHRGTPWQTVYLKAGNILAAARGRDYWARDWTGNTNLFDAMNASPVTDRLLFDLFTTTISQESSRGQLSVNQSALPAWSAVFGGVLAVTNDMTDKQVQALAYATPRQSPRYRALPIEPAGVYNPGDTNTWSPMVKLVEGINRTRADTNLFPWGFFTRVGDILAVPELTDRSPFLNQTTTMQQQNGLTDAAYERLPQQVLGLLKVGEPRFVIYAYGQTLRPAPNSVVASGPFAGLCENYQIVAEAAIRAVVRVEGAPDQPRVVIEDYNPLPPD